ncbi:DUF1254 domain-containing protein [Vibrio sp. ZSDE26]|uniref:DUF1254 domain-containing protein n=1 Tax=Vibrio amylolyticus TaxID=2847292 RepID=A0A9X1XIC8_9VIBR|nr:DUF1214 domain-containing protein [Vibrio amylolyticus]MCK6263504.1 DUF1254 domain-containing protein [Vibrio amylolyticus]
MKKTALTLALCIATSATSLTLAHAEPTVSTQTKAASFSEQRFERRALEAGTWFIPQVLYETLASETINKFGGDRNSTVYFFERPVTWHTQMMTGNNNTPYVHTYHSIEDGPVVLEIPAATQDNAFFGTLLDSWHKPLIDVGPDGADKGKGGKYLIVQPGYTGDTTGYIVVEQETFQGYTTIRSMTKTTSEGDMKGHVDYVKQGVKIYPLGAKNTTTTFKEMDNVVVDTHLQWQDHFSTSFWERAHRALQNEVVKKDEKAMYGMLRHLGLEKGEKFAPTPKQQVMLNEALVKLHAEMKDSFTHYAPRLWGEQSQWTIPVNREMMLTDATYTSDNWHDYAGRGTTFAYYIAPPKSLAESRSTTYIKGILDADGNPMYGDYDYTIHVPSNVPAERFWSFLTYSMETGSFIYEADRLGWASNEPEMTFNSDGSADIYWSSECDSRNYANCMPITKGEQFFTLFRLYGPQADFFNGNFVLSDIQKVEHN